MDRLVERRTNSILKVCIRLMSNAFVYRVSHLLVDLGLVDFDLGVPPSYPAAQPFLPNSHQPRQNGADSGTLKIQVNPTSPRTDESPCTRMSERGCRVRLRFESAAVLTQHLLLRNPNTISPSSSLSRPPNILPHSTVCLKICTMYSQKADPK